MLFGKLAKPATHTQKASAHDNTDMQHEVILLLIHNYTHENNMGTTCAVPERSADRQHLEALASALLHYHNLQPVGAETCM